MGPPQTQDASPQGPQLYYGREQPATAYYASVVLKGQVVDALIDTGSSITVISEDFFRTLPETFVGVQPEQPRYEGVVAGSVLDVLGIFPASVAIGPFYSEPHPIIVVRDTRNPCIIGMDFLDQFYISVDTSARKLTIKPPNVEEVSIGIVPAFPNSFSGLKVVNSMRVQVAPRSVGCIQVSIRGLDYDLDGYIEGLDRTNVKFMVPHSLHRVKDGLSYIDCINVTDEPIVIQREQNVGTFLPIHDVNVSQPQSSATPPVTNASEA